jgi:MOSC domain-containing protein YiiM
MTALIELVHLYVSPGHNYFGHHGQPPGQNPVQEVEELHCVAGHGIRGDRFFDYQPNYKGQITFFAEEVYESVCQNLGVWHKPPSVFRRNVLTRGLSLNDLVGAEFNLQGVRFLGVEQCKPCYWMDQAFAPGAEAALAGRGGLRARILTGGILRPTRVRTAESSHHLAEAV